VRQPFLVVRGEFRLLSLLARLQPAGRRPYIRPYQPYLFVLPGFLIYAVFVLVPIIQTARYSLTDWTGFSDPILIGFGNYSALINDRDFWNALGHNFFFAIFYTILPILLGLFLTSLLTRGKLRGLSLFRTGLFLPQVMSPVVVGIIWRWLFELNGPINQFLEGIGLGEWTQAWLGDFFWAPFAVGAVGTWVEYGLAMVLFIAGAQAIDEDLYDAAKVFGANAWQQFRYVTLPGLRQQILVAVVITFIASMRIFDLVYVLTRQGGPGKQTTVVSILIYLEAFQKRNAGYAAAMAVVLTLIIVSISALVLYLQSRRDAQESL
jgi:raffinose/stachyose/melibiose transport system permease protein